MRTVFFRSACFLRRLTILPRLSTVRQLHTMRQDRDAMGAYRHSSRFVSFT